MVLQNHEQHIAKNGAASQEAVQYINALSRENEKKNMWIGSLMREVQANARFFSGTTRDSCSLLK